MAVRNGEPEKPDKRDARRKRQVRSRVGAEVRRLKELAEEAKRESARKNGVIAHWRLKYNTIEQRYLDEKKAVKFMPAAISNAINLTDTEKKLVCHVLALAGRAGGKGCWSSDEYLGGLLKSQNHPNGCIPSWVNASLHKAVRLGYLRKKGRGRNRRFFRSHKAR